MAASGARSDLLLRSEGSRFWNGVIANRVPAPRGNGRSTNKPRTVMELGQGGRPKTGRDVQVPRVNQPRVTPVAASWIVRLAANWSGGPGRPVAYSRCPVAGQTGPQHPKWRLFP